VDRNSQCFVWENWKNVSTLYCKMPIYGLTRRATRGGTFGAFVPPKFSKYCMAILTFVETSEE